MYLEVMELMKPLFLVLDMDQEVEVVCHMVVDLEEFAMDGIFKVIFHLFVTEATLIQTR